MLALRQLLESCTTVSSQTSYDNTAIEKFRASKSEFNQSEGNLDHNVAISPACILHSQYCTQGKGGGGPTFSEPALTERTFWNSAGKLKREEMLDNYSQHTQHCTACSRVRPMDNRECNLIACKHGSSLASCSQSLKALNSSSRSLSSTTDLENGLLAQHFD